MFKILAEIKDSVINNIEKEQRKLAKEGKICFKCGKKLTFNNVSNVCYMSNPLKYTCKDCELKRYDKLKSMLDINKEFLEDLEIYDYKPKKKTISL